MVHNVNQCRNHGISQMFPNIERRKYLVSFYE
jgi:hypothetical protein